MQTTTSSETKVYSVKIGPTNKDTYTAGGAGIEAAVDLIRRELGKGIYTVEERNESFFVYDVDHVLLDRYYIMGVDNG